MDRKIRIAILSCVIDFWYEAQTIQAIYPYCQGYLKRDVPNVSIESIQMELDRLVAKGVISQDHQTLTYRIV